jgi:hypothetical protein
MGIAEARLCETTLILNRTPAVTQPSSHATPARHGMAATPISQLANPLLGHCFSYLPFDHVADVVSVVSNHFSAVVADPACRSYRVLHANGRCLALAHDSRDARTRWCSVECLDLEECEIDSFALRDLITMLQSLKSLSLFNSQVLPPLECEDDDFSFWDPIFSSISSLPHIQVCLSRNITMIGALNASFGSFHNSRLSM